MTTTALNIINEALSMVGALASGETADANIAASALRRLNSMVDSWNNESLMVYQVQTEELTLPANTSVATIGDGGNFDTDWPINVLSSTYTQSSSSPDIDFPVRIINQAQFNSITDKAVTGPYPQYIYYERAYPLGSLYFWPVPSGQLSLFLSTWKRVQSFGALAVEMILPPGYEEALTYNLAVRIASQEGVEASPSVQKIAVESKRNLKRVNGQNDVLDMPVGLPGMVGRPGYWDFYSGGS